MRVRIPPPAPLRPLSYRWLLVLTLGLTETVSWGVLFYSFSVFVGPMQAELGWTRGEITGAFSLAVLVWGIAGLALGPWIDARGPRLLMTVGSAAAVALVLAWSGVTDIRAFYGCWLLMGFVWAAVLYGPAFATVAAWFPQGRTQALTALTLMAGLASTIFLPLTAALVASLGWRDALVALAVLLGVTTIAPHALVLRRAPGHLAEIAGPSLSVREAMRHPSFPWFVIGFFSGALTLAMAVHFVPYLVGRGYALGDAAVLAGAIGAMQLVGRLLLAPLERRLPATGVVAILYALQPFAFASLLVLPAPAGPYVFVALFGASRGADTLLRNTLVARAYGVRRFASIAGVLSVVVTLAQAIGPAAVGALYDAVGSYTPGIAGLVAASVVATLAITRAVAVSR